MSGNLLIIVLISIAFVLWSVIVNLFFKTIDKQKEIIHELEVQNSILADEYMNNLTQRVKTQVYLSAILGNQENADELIIIDDEFVKDCIIKHFESKEE